MIKIVDKNEEFSDEVAKITTAKLTHTHILIKLGIFLEKKMLT